MYILYWYLCKTFVVLKLLFVILLCRGRQAIVAHSQPLASGSVLKILFLQNKTFKFCCNKTPKHKNRFIDAKQMQSYGALT